MISKANLDWMQKWIDQCGWLDTMEGGYVDLPEDDFELYGLIEDLQTAKRDLERYLKT